MIRRSMIAMFVLLGLGLTGCGSLLQSDAPPATQWWLVPSPLSESTARLQSPLILQLDVVPGLDTDRILNLNENARLNSYSGATWPDDLPDVLESLLQRSLESISDAPVRRGTRADASGCLLRLQVREFFGRVDSTGVTHKVQFEIHGELTCPQFSRVVSSRQSASVSENRMGPIIGAFQRALDDGLQDLATQLEQSP